MANHLTGAQRYNNKLHKIFAEGRILNSIHDKGRENHAKQKHKGEYSSCVDCHGPTENKGTIKGVVAKKMKK